MIPLYFVREEADQLQYVVERLVAGRRVVVMVFTYDCGDREGAAARAGMCVELLNGPDELSKVVKP